MRAMLIEPLGEDALLLRLGNAIDPADAAFPPPAEYPNGQIYTVTNQPRTIGLRFSQKF